MLPPYVSHLFYNSPTLSNGALAQGYERYLHTVEVTGSNPVRPTISIYNSKDAQVTIEIFDASGQRVRSLSPVAFIYSQIIQNNSHRFFSMVYFQNEVQPL